MMKTEIFADTFRYRVWSEGRQCAGTACGVRERLTACGVRERLAECGNGLRGNRESEFEKVGKTWQKMN